MKNILLFIFLMGSFTASAQLIVDRPSADAYQIIYDINYAGGISRRANLGGSTKMFSETNPGYLIWYEYGDGKFTMQPSFVHGYSSTVPISNPFLKLTGVYETGGKPTRLLNANSITPSNAMSSNYNYEANDPLTGTYNVKITPNVGSVRNDETMHFAIDYKVPESKGAWRLVFEYNINGDHSFKQADGSKMLVDDVDRTLKAPHIRVHNQEVIDDRQYNKVVFTNLTSSRNAKTVFVTLETLDNISEDDPAISVTAYLIKDNETAPNSNNQDLNSMRGKGNKPHDPNWVKVDRKCIIPNTLGMNLNYHVRFQNTGTGPADDIVHVAIKVPEEIKPALLNPTTSNFQVDISGIVMTKFDIYRHLTATHDSFAPGIVYYDGNTHTDTLHFSIRRPDMISGVILQGMDSTKPNFMNDLKTMGNIKFKVTLPSYKPCTDIYAQAAIVFDREHSVLTDKEKTKVRRKCKSKRKPADCNCGKKQKRSFWQWLKETCG